MTSKKVIIVDPAQNSPHSHNYQYNTILAKQAADAGYDVTMLFGLDDKSDFSGTKADIKRIFPHSTYDFVEIHSPFRSKRTQRLMEVRNMVARKLADPPVPTFFRLYPDVAKIIGFIYRALIVMLSPVLHLGNYLFDRYVYKSRPYNKDVFAELLAAELTASGFGPGDVLIAHSASPGMAESFLSLRPLMNLTAPIPAKLALIFHHSVSERRAEDWYLAFYQRSELGWLAKRWKAGSPCETTAFYALSPELATELGEQTGLPFQHFEHIVQKETLNRVFGDGLAPSPTPPRHTVIGLRAANITEENAPDLVKMIEEVRAYYPYAQFKVLARSQAAQSIPQARVMSSDPNLEVIVTVSDDEYLRSLGGLDILVLPYEARGYRKRISAVAYEAALLGVAIVAPSDTTMTSVSAPGIVFAYSAPGEIGKTMLRAIDTLDRSDYASFKECPPDTRPNARIAGRVHPTGE